MNDQAFVDGCVARAYRINKRFFGKDATVRIQLVRTRKEMDEEWGESTRSWFVAFGWGERIVVFAPSVLEQVSNYRVSHYQDIITHEMNHLFYHQVFGTYKPSWIIEGIALYVEGKEYVNKGKIKTSNLRYTTNRKFFSNPEATADFYEQSAVAVRRIIRKLGKKKFLKLLQRYSKNPTKQNYVRIFSRFMASAQ